MDQRIKAYIYPLSARPAQGLYNPYLDHFMDSLSRDVRFVNRDHRSRVGIAQAFRYIGNVQAIFLNWVENIPDRAGGHIQFLLLIVLLFSAKLTRTRIIWILHNKLSHERSHRGLKKMIFSLMARFSTLIVAHSSEGVTFLAEQHPRAVAKAIVIPHPVTERPILPSAATKSYDILIWGTMHPYKRILEFVQFCSLDPRARPFKVLIAGKFMDMEYFSRVQECRNENMTLENRFIDESELMTCTASSRYTLFPYAERSVLSSGALMDALGMRANIIGPRAGAFSDLARLGLVDVFDRFEDIPDIVQGPDRTTDRAEKLTNFITENTWDHFARKLRKYLI